MPPSSGGADARPEDRGDREAEARDASTGTGDAAGSWPDGGGGSGGRSPPQAGRAAAAVANARGSSGREVGGRYQI